MTNYERICADKAFCASVLANITDVELHHWTEWLNREQREVSDERAQEGK